MKFTDGNWLNREGVAIHAAAEAYEVECKENSLEAYAPCQVIRHRGATLAGPTLTVQFSSPMPDVIRVQAYHFKGQLKKGPTFQINNGPSDVLIEDGTEFAQLTTGNLSVRVKKGDPWTVEFFDQGTRLTGSSGRKSLAFIQDQGQPWMRELLDLDAGELVYGLGERFTPFVKNGQSLDTWNRDGGTSSDQSYKTIPFYLSNKGYGVLVNHPENVDFEVGTEHVSKVQFSVQGECLDYFIINGCTPKDVISRYTALTGRPALPPAWSFGLWLTTSFTTNYDENTVMHFINGMEERDVPLRIFHFDCFWMRAFEWCNFEWDEKVFPDPKGMLQRIKAKGYRVCVWINPYIAQKSKLFDLCAEQGYLLKRPNGDVWQWDLWQPGMGVIDFTNPSAREWYKSQLRALVEMGVDAFKTDFGERIPLDVEYFNHADPAKMHNYYSFLYNQTVFEVLQETLGHKEAVVFARSATVGGQQFPVHWGGDCSASYPSMAESLRGGLSLGLCGFGFWSHDISGFEDSATPDLYKRWVAFGMLSSHSRLHGNSSYRVPWLFDEEAVDVLRHFTRLKNQLMPYLYNQAIQASKTGVPMMRAMLLEFPGDPTCEHLDRQYMLGDFLLVAPIFREDGQVTYYLPEGRWTHLLTGQVVQGGKWLKETHDYFSLPLYVRQNTLLALGSQTDRVDYDYAEGVTLHLFELEDGSSATVEVFDVDGALQMSGTVKRHSNTLTITADSASNKAWSICLRGIEAASCTGGVTEPSAKGIRVIANAGETQLTVVLS